MKQEADVPPESYFVDRKECWDELLKGLSVSIQLDFFF